MTPVLLHLPHDSTVIPSADRADYLISDADLGLEQLRLTDWHTAALYAEGMPTDEIVCAEVSRLVVDVERFADDRLERCSAFGMGATYVQTCDGRPLRALSPERRKELLDRYYWPHHHRLNEAAAERLTRFGQCVILDAHSFPTGQLPTQVGFSAPLEIAIGTQPGHTSPELRALAEDFFSAQGFTVGVDIPFSGAIVPNRYFGKEFRVQSLMIEVRRNLYMDESTSNQHAGFARIQGVLTEFRAELTRFATT